MCVPMHVLFVEFCVYLSQIKRCLYFSARSAITEAAEGMELSSRNVYRVHAMRTHVPTRKTYEMVSTTYSACYHEAKCIDFLRSGRSIDVTFVPM